MTLPGIRLVVLLAWLFGNAGVQAATVVFDAIAEHSDLSASMALLHDPDGHLHFTEVVTMEDAFRPARREDLTRSFNAGVFWLRFALLHTGPEKETRWLTLGTPRLQSVTMYLRDGGNWQVLNSGTRVSMLQKPIVAAHAAFPITLAPGENREVLLRVDSSSALDMAAILWKPHAYRMHASERSIVLALIIGGLLLGSLLSIVVYYRLRDPSHAWLALLLLALSGLEATRENLLALYLWPASWGFPPQLLAMLAAMAIFALAKLVAGALRLDKHLPHGSRVLQVLRWGAVGAAALSLFDYGTGIRIMALIVVMLLPISLALSWLAWRRGIATAKSFAFAFSVALLAETARQLANLGALPWIGAMNLSLMGFLLSTPFIMLSIVEQTRHLSQQLEVAQELQQAKTAFLARVSHELRSPLNTILGYARMLNRGSSRLSVQEGSSGIEKGALRLLGLIDELLDESRAAAGKLAVAPIPTYFAALMNEVCAAAQTFSEAQGNRFDCKRSGEIPEAIVIDGQRLRQVLENLLSNANRHTHHGTISLEYSGRCEGDIAILDFAVRDNGEGIAPDRMKMIFEPFVRGQEAQTEDRRRRSGFGLGLSISRELVRQMGSDIAVSSRLGQGSCFSFSLRCSLAAPEDAILITPPPTTQAVSVSSTPHSPPPSSISVLLVEDDPQQLRLLADSLAESGLIVHEASSGNAIANALQEIRLDAIITDQMMSDGDGWQVLRLAHAAVPDMPVLLLSAAAPQRPADFPLNVNFAAMLRKPVSTEELLATLAWQTLKVDAGGTPLKTIRWQELLSLAKSGEVSAMEDWIAAIESARPGNSRLAAWLRGALNRLDFALIEHFARHAGNKMSARGTRLS